MLGIILVPVAHAPEFTLMSVPCAAARVIIVSVVHAVTEGCVMLVVYSPTGDHAEVLSMC